MNKPCCEEINGIPSADSIHKLAASVRATVWIDPPGGPYFKFKFGEAAWSPPMLAIEAREYLQEMRK